MSTDWHYQIWRNDGAQNCIRYFVGFRRQRGASSWKGYKSRHLSPPFKKKLLPSKHSFN